MIISLVAGLAASAFWPFGSHAKAGAEPRPRPAHAQHFRSVAHWRVGRWLLTVRHDHFTGAEVCSLVRGRAHVDRQTLVLQLPRDVDTANAQYRIDEGASTGVEQDRPALAKQGFAVWQDSLDNPSGGLVRIALPRLSGARTVWVETRRNGRIWALPVDGLDAGLAAERREGCP